MYKPTMSLKETQKAIKLIKVFFEHELSERMNLTRVSAPLFVERESGINDDLNGIERPVSFDILETGKEVEIVQSLAKWKRKALKDYGANHVCRAVRTHGRTLAGGRQLRHGECAGRLRSLQYS